MGSLRTRTVLCSFLIVVVLFGEINTERNHHKAPQNRNRGEGHKETAREIHNDNHESEQNEETYTSQKESVEESKSRYVPQPIHKVEEHETEHEQEHVKKPEKISSSKSKPHRTHRIQKRVQPKTKIALKQGNTQSPPEDDKKKNTHVAFVLYNREIKFLKQDDVTSNRHKTALKFNCVFIVTSSNRCLGFEMPSSKNQTQSRLRKRQQGKKKLRSRKASPIEQLLLHLSTQ